ncbi:folate-binding protein [Candidatus Endowatersipora endosymbiont of Watersipora subatra]|uniref:CAF17-like 4Fe-4S cluster assembly/insertion protein YgfZ n=1 Tax=Candidatus Endowatersipora endosymbiont of Watersipora subatra TaxID=3077946 RepID=UPI00312C7737
MHSTEIKTDKILLHDRAILEVYGNHAEIFLQNLITCNIIGMNSGHATFGGLLTPQGKILHEFILQKKGDSFLLDCHRNHRDHLVERLIFYRLRSEVIIKKRNHIVFVQLKRSESIDEEGFLDPRSGNLGRRWFTLLYSEKNLKNDFSVEWHRRRIESGIPELGHDFHSDQVFPHEAFYDRYLKSGVDFNKGCYVGQEIVSRMQNRGITRKRFVLCKTENGEALPEHGIEIITKGRRVGTIGSSINEMGLAFVRWDRVENALISGDIFTANGQKIILNHPQ